MAKIPFTDLPFATKLGLMLIPFMGWVMFAEFVIDRNGWDRFLPFYKFGQFCPYDLAVLAVLAFLWWRLEHDAKAKAKSKEQAEAQSEQQRPPRATGACC